MKKKSGTGLFRNIPAMRHVIIFAVAAVCVALSVAKLYAVSINQDDVSLFAEKCGKCHGWNKAIAAFSGPLGNKKAEIIIDMQRKKPGFISDAERDRITQLLTANDVNLVGAEAENLSPAKVITKSEMIKKVISGFHGGFMALLFLSLGLYMTLTGLKRFFVDVKIFEGFPVKFNRAKHVKAGKFYIVLLLLGLLGGLSILYMSHFNADGAKYHLFAAILISVLYAIGGLTGLALAKTKGKSPSGLKYTHLACNVAATLLFVFNIISGVSLALLVLK